MKKTLVIRVFTLFSGYDSQIMALMRLQKWANKYYPTREIEFKIVGWCEIDEYAVMSHNVIFPEYAEPFNPETGKGFYHKDVTKIDWTKVPTFDLLFYSSCCQDITRSGAQRGLEEGTGTRSSLIWNVLDAIRIIRPKWAILENVAALVENKFMQSFIKWQRSVDSLGYISTWKLLNAGNYDIPQNRNRVFMVSCREDLNQVFLFPTPIERVRTINEFLDEDVSSEYYFAENDALKLLCRLNDKEIIGETECEMETKPLSGKKLRELSVVTPTCRGDIRDESIAPMIPTLMASGGVSPDYRNGYHMGHFPQPLVLEVWEDENHIAVDYTSQIMSSLDKKSCKQDKPVEVVNAHKNLIQQTVARLSEHQFLRLRRLSPSEYLRFMGVSEKDINKLINSVVPKEQLYKQAGNSIVVDVLFQIFKSLFINN